MPCQQLEEHDADGVDVRRLILVHHVAQDQLRGRVGGLAHEGARRSELAVLRVQVVQTLGDAEVNQLDLPVVGKHDVRRVDVTVDNPLVMQGGDARQDVLDDLEGELFGLLLGQQIQVPGELALIPFGILELALEQVLEHDAAQELADNMVMGHRLPVRKHVHLLDEVVHPDEILVVDLDAGFPAGTLDRLGRQVVK